MPQIFNKSLVSRDLLKSNNMMLKDLLTANKFL